MKLRAGEQLSLEHAVRLEQSGRLEEAAHAYLALGSVEAAARVLAAARHFADAARLLLSLMGPDPTRDAEARRLAHHAAMCLAHAGERQGAASLLRAIGDEARAAAVLGALPPSAPDGALPDASPTSMRPTQRGIAGSLEAAAHEARANGRPRDAALLFQRASLTFEAGICFSDAGDWAEALAHLVAVPSTSPHYRTAAVRVIQIVARTGALSFDVDNFVASFARSDPTTAREIAALYTLGLLYERTGFPDEARDAYERVIKMDRDHVEASKRVSLLSATPGKEDYAALAQQDMSFWATARRTVPDVESVAVEIDRTTSSGSAVPVAGLTSLQAGSVVAERYMIEREIGRGGMGVVYAARDIDLGELVALKAFAARVEDPGLVARFKQELTLTRQLTHENVIRLHDMGVHEGYRFITMELLSGESLKAKIADLELHEALGYLVQLCAGVRAIHGRNVVHRDIKPANVWVTAEDVVKVMDFGLAKKAGSGEPGLTVSGFMAGTPGYMPPEQITSFGSVTTAADMYALGVVAYELTTGGRPFKHRDPSQIFRLQFTTEPVAPSTHNSAIPPALDTMIVSLLDRDPSRRPKIDDVLALLTSIRLP